MIIKKYIIQTLNDIDISFNNALRSPETQHSIYFSKLAILEYCGWLEEAFDEIVRRSVKGRLKTPDYRNMLNISIIGKNHGFEYKKHFRRMLMSAIGISNMEKIEIELKNTGEYDKLVSELDAIKTQRDNAAHTWINGAISNYDTPAYIKARFNTVYPIIRNIYSKIVKLYP